MPTGEFRVDEIPSDRWELALALYVMAAHS
jgi:hypothetical protein